MPERLGDANMTMALIDSSHREVRTPGMTAMGRLEPFVLNRRRYSRSSRGGDVTIERRGRDAEAVRDLRHADVGIGEHRLGGLDVVVRQSFGGRPPVRPARPRGGEARLGTLPDQAAFEFRRYPTKRAPDLPTGPLDVDRVETRRGSRAAGVVGEVGSPRGMDKRRFLGSPP
jgi:hypothetical protein